MRHTPEYAIAEIREALAQDPRTSELYVDVKIVGKQIFLTGEVATVERRSAITEIVAELEPGFEIRNETTLVRPTDEPREESVS